MLPSELAQGLPMARFNRVIFGASHDWLDSDGRHMGADLGFERLRKHSC